VTLACIIIILFPIVTFWFVLSQRLLNPQYVYNQNKH